MAKGLKHRADNDPRVASLLALHLVMRGTDSQAALDQVLSASKIVPSDKALATELFYGTLRHHLRLEWFLRQKLAKPQGLPDEMFLLLEQSIYELAHTRIPAHAGVNWAVGLVRGRFGAGLSKVANGVLRSFERNKKSEYFNINWYAEKLGEAHDSLAVQAIWHALPLWLVEYWAKNYPPVTLQALLNSATQPAAQALRINSRHPEAGEAITLLKEQGSKELAPTLFSIPQKVRLPISVWIKRGVASRQSPAAYLALFALQPETWAQPLWDACAGRGGKSLALLERGIAVHSASDPSKGRIMGLAADYKRLSLNEPPCPRLINATAQNAIKLADAHSAAFNVGGCATPKADKPEPNMPEAAKNTDLDKAGGGERNATGAQQEHELNHDKTPAQTSGEGHGQSSEHGFTQMYGQSPGQTSGQSSGEAYVQTCGQDSGQNFEQNACLKQFFGTVLVDAPCSGLGTLAHRPEIRWRRNAADIAKLQNTQAEILDAAHVALKGQKGSRLIYITCTVSRAENQGQISAFLQRHPEYTLVQEYESPPEAELGEFFYGAVLLRQN